MNPELEKAMRRAASNMEYLYSSEAPETVDIYSSLEVIAEKFITQGYGNELSWEMAYAKIESEELK